VISEASVTANGVRYTHNVPGRVPLARALSKLGISSRSEAIAQILSGRVAVAGRIVRDPGHLVVPESARITLDGATARRTAWRLLMLNKTRGTVTTRRDPEGRPTVFDALGDEARGLVAVGRLDLATTGLLLLTTDTRLAHQLTDPASGIARRYVVTVRGSLSDGDAERLVSGIDDLRADSVRVRKRSARETHLIVGLREGRNREIRRLCAAVGHEVTALKRVAFGGLELGDLAPGRWRGVSKDELRRAVGRATAVPSR
jgi:23S rRNA pseudouridine2605 synthase